MLGCPIPYNSDSETDVNTQPFQKAKRRKTVSRKNNMSKREIRKLARQAGVVRLSSMVYDEMNNELKTFLRRIIGDSLLYMECAHRKTCTKNDVVYALKRNGITLYG